MEASCPLPSGGYCCPQLPRRSSSGKTFDDGKKRQGMAFPVGPPDSCDRSGSSFFFTIDDAKIVRSRSRPAEWRKCCRALKHKRVAAFLQAIARVVNCSEISSMSPNTSLHTAECSPVCSETCRPLRSGCPLTFALLKAWVRWSLIVTALVIALGGCHRTSESADS